MPATAAAKRLPVQRSASARAEAAEPEVKEAEDAQRPGQRQRDEEERAGVEAHSAPLREEGRAAVGERVPQRQFARAEAFAQVVRGRVGHDAVVGAKESFRAQPDAGEGEDEGEEEEDGEAARGEPGGQSRVWGLGSRVWGGGGGGGGQGE